MTPVSQGGGDPRKVPQPPKFGPNSQIVYPKSISDWMSFTRWLVSLWQAASTSTDAPQVDTITPRPPNPASEQNVLGAALSFGTEQRRGSREPDAAAIGLLGAGRPGIVHSDELNALTLMGLTNQRQPKAPESVGLLGPKQTFGVVSASSSTTVTLDSGDPFYPAMAGHSITFAGELHYVVAYVDAGTITVETALALSGASYYFDEYPPGDFDEGTLRWFTDWTTLYVDIDQVSTCDVSGTSVTHVSGQPFFNPYWVGKRITINGDDYTIQNGVTPTGFSIDRSAGSHSGVAYTMKSGAWQYAAGQFTVTQTSIPGVATRCGTYDVGLIVYSSDYAHSYQWQGTGFTFAPGDPGSGFIVIVEGGLDGGEWALCDGSTVSLARSGGGVAAYPTPNFTTDALIQGGGSGHKVATRATWESTAKTEDESTHTHDVTITSDHTPPGPTPPDFTFAVPGTYTTTAGTAHHHTLNDADAQLKKFSEADGGMPERFGTSFYVRR